MLVCVCMYVWVALGRGDGDGECGQQTYSSGVAATHQRALGSQSAWTSRPVNGPIIYNIAMNTYCFMITTCGRKQLHVHKCVSAMIL